MSNFTYGLNSYSTIGSLTWQNCLSHIEEAKKSSGTTRWVHIGIAACEFLPLIGQIASLLEQLIVTWNNDSNQPKIPLTAHSYTQSTVSTEEKAANAPSPQTKQEEGKRPVELQSADPSSQLSGKEIAPPAEIADIKSLEPNPNDKENEEKYEEQCGIISNTPQPEPQIKDITHKAEEKDNLLAPATLADKIQNLRHRDMKNKAAAHVHILSEQGLPPPAPILVRDVQTDLKSKNNSPYFGKDFLEGKQPNGTALPRFSSLPLSDVYNILLKGLRTQFRIKNAFGRKLSKQELNYMQKEYNFCECLLLEYKFEILSCTCDGPNDRYMVAWHEYGDLQSLRLYENPNDLIDLSAHLFEIYIKDTETFPKEIQTDLNDAHFIPAAQFEEVRELFRSSSFESKSK